ncbi:hypothetical protein NM688_g1887 [Phlebia brevispora]|uniref:Uncharacterized protein n=1 Tax=Phlebia brevispora TaxID=194682 RepID=A0ACC1T9U0_9APHY|nr:hypothetical protein NM688_g1887 [Phlebia brevispora]
MTVPPPAASSSCTKSRKAPPQTDSATHARQSKAPAPLHFKQIKPSAPEDRQPQTPTICKAVMGYSAYGKVDNVRAAALRDMGQRIKEVTIECFLHKLLPPLDPRINIEDVVRRLESGAKPALTLDDQEGKWWSAFKEEPKDTDGEEDPVYKPFAEVVNSILKASSLSSDNFAYVQLPTKSPLCTLHRILEKPDGYGYLLHREGDEVLKPGCKQPSVPYWRQIVVTAEFKKSDTSTPDHNKCFEQVCGNMLQVMRDDATRRFTYGFTVENLRVRFWYCNRSEIVVSNPFDMMMDNETLIHFFLALAHPPSPADIGFDPTIVGPRRPGPQGVTSYDIQVHCMDKPRTFRTIRLLYWERARALRGSGTRVWEARELVNGVLVGPRVAIKDTWVDSDRMREGVIIPQVKRDAVAAGSNPEVVEKGFLTVVCHGDVQLGGVADKTLAIKASRRLKIHSTTKGEEKEEANSYQIRSAVGSCIDSYSKGKHISPTIDYDRKTHYWIVFREVGVPLRLAKLLDQAYHSLATVILALHAMHQSGWVHRDISANNIIYVNGVAKLADLEYARKEGSTQRCHQLRTSSTFYLSVEAGLSKYRFKAPDNTKPPVAKVTIQETTKMPIFQPRDPVKKEGKIPNQIEFHYNPLHDLESLWWVAVYLVSYKFVRAGHVDDDRSKDNIEKHDGEISSVFLSLKERYAFLTDTTTFQSYGTRLHPAVRPIWITLEGLRSTIVETYRRLEVAPQSIRFQDVVQTGMHNMLYSSFYQLALESGGIRILPKPKKEENVKSKKSKQYGSTANSSKQPEKPSNRTAASVTIMMQRTGLKREP